MIPPPPSPLPQAQRAPPYALAGSLLSDIGQRILGLNVCVYRLREQLETAQLVMYTRLDDPLGLMLDGVIRRLQSGGFPALWLSSLSAGPTKSAATAEDEAEGDGDATGRQIAVAASVLALGLLLAAAVFLAEVLAPATARCWPRWAPPSPRAAAGGQRAGAQRRRRRRRRHRTKRVVFRGRDDRELYKIK
ncbi:hypothetical protein ONE63_005798 [Megalurothrips usitatus]|uniref:Uncharacterized protein n=1 Tax=Megalurothrips usitatus TaxID=439358 RepID=A0AAV7Y0J9_9NEOP|nr:hypothetical protein ONE63_005798 [Megalurothrips usitatus]